MTRTSGDDAAAAVVGKDARALHTEQKRDTRPGIRSPVVCSGVRAMKPGNRAGTTLKANVAIGTERRCNGTCEVGLAWRENEGQLSAWIWLNEPSGFLVSRSSRGRVSNVFASEGPN